MLHKHPIAGDLRGHVVGASEKIQMSPFREVGTGGRGVDVDVHPNPRADVFPKSQVVRAGNEGPSVWFKFRLGPSMQNLEI